MYHPPTSHFQFVKIFIYISAEELNKTELFWLTKTNSITWRCRTIKKKIKGKMTDNRLKVMKMRKKNLN